MVSVHPIQDGERVEGYMVEKHVEVTEGIVRADYEFWVGQYMEKFYDGLEKQKLLRWQNMLSQPEITIETQWAEEQLQSMCQEAIKGEKPNFYFFNSGGK